MLIGLLLTIVVGLFFLIGIFILNKSKDKIKTNCFSLSLALVVLFGLLVFDLLPELLETKNILLIIPVIIGFCIITLLDKLIPHHHHKHSDTSCDKHDHEEHLNHIGVITIIALAIHNMIEGLSLYNVTINNVKSGVLRMLAI